MLLKHANGRPIRQLWRHHRGILCLAIGAAKFFEAFFQNPMQWGAWAMDVALWQRGLFLLLTHAFGVFQSDILSQCHLRPELYTWDFFQRSNCVYVRIFVSPHLKRHTYVGSSTGTLGFRERTRLGKYRQLIRSQHVVGELALWWYLKTDTYHLAVPIVFMHCPLKRCLHAVEQFWIQFWRPTLNAPFIKKFFRGKHSLRTVAVRVTAARRHLYSFRLHRRYRQMARKGYASQPGPFRDANIVRAAMFSLQVLFDLAAEGLQSFLAAKLLRSGHVDDLLIYQLYRLGCSLGDPHCETIVRKRLRKIMLFRKMTVPSEPSSLCIRGLGHPSFAADTRKLLRTLLQDSQATLLPFHIPKLQVGFKAHPKVKDVLFNFKELVECWEPDGTDSLPCNCQSLSELFPDLDLSDGHVASPASKLGIPGLLGDIASSSANNQVFASVSSLFGSLRASLHRWCKNHHVRFPDDDSLRLWWDAQVKIHSEFVRDARKWTVIDVLHLQSLFPTLVWHVRDHQAGHIHVFCRKKYSMMLCHTFQNKEVFRAVDMTAGQAFSTLESCVPAPIEKAFAWGFQFRKKDAALPWSYILPKHKKAWKAGRPIISFCCHPARKFLMGLAKVVDFLVLETCPHCKTYNDALAIWKDVHRHLGAVSETETVCEEQCLFNQDLAGFFISIPQERFGVALRFMLCRLYNVAFFSDLPTALADKRVTVRLDKEEKMRKVFKGKLYRAGGKDVCVPMALMLEAVDCSFKFNMFRVGRHVFEQRMGSPMGSPISPALCHAVVSDFEHRAFSHILRNNAALANFSAGSLFVARYVDNRIAIMSRFVANLSVMSAFLAPDVYLPPICLEDEEGSVFLGFDVQIQSAAVKFVQPTEGWQLLHQSSAASKWTLLSGLRSRSVNVVRCCWPKRQACEDLETLCQWYVAHGFSQSEVVSATRLARSILQNRYRPM